MSILEKKGYRLRLNIIGSGNDLPRLKKISQQLGLGERTVFTGFAGEDKKIEMLRRAAVFVNPSEKEGWGITNIEAAACGTPVVANDAPGLRDSVVNGETGLLYNDNDAHALSLSIQSLIDNKELRERFGVSGRSWAEKFSWDTSAQKVENWLQKIVRER
jgi:glycosyltransferase involved in cell wall biosynthesis